VLCCLLSIRFLSDALTTTQTLCQELVDDVIGYLHDDKATLWACSLTCRTMVAAAQRGLFLEIFVWARRRGPINFPPAFTIQRLAEMVNALPHVATFLHITLDPTGLQMTDINEFARVLLKFRQLARFLFCLHPLADTFKLRSFLAFTIPAVLCCPTLRHVELMNMPNILPRNAALKHLVLCSNRFGEHWAPEMAGPIATLEFLALDAWMDAAGEFFDYVLMHKRLDLSGIKQLYINAGFRATILDNAHVNRFLRICGISLRCLKLSIPTRCM
jgi:hypothetical protein